MSTNIRNAAKKYFWTDALQRDKEDIKFIDLKGTEHRITFYELSRPDVISFVTEVYAHALHETNANGEYALTDTGAMKRKSFKTLTGEFDDLYYKWFALATDGEKDEEYFKNLFTSGLTVMGVFAYMTEIMHMVNHIDEILEAQGNWPALRVARESVLIQQALDQTNPTEPGATIS